MRVCVHACVNICVCVRVCVCVCGGERDNSTLDDIFGESMFSESSEGCLQRGTTTLSSQPLTKDYQSTFNNLKDYEQNQKMKKLGEI